VARNIQSRRHYGFGSVYQRRPGRGWTIDYRTPSGERVQKVVKGAVSKTQALKALQNALLKAHGVKEEKVPVKFKEFADLYLKNYAMVKKRAWERSDRVYLNANLVPYFGRYELTRITPLLIERFIAKRLRDGVKKSTINRDLSCLKKMFNKAIDWNYLSENPLRKVKLFPEKDSIRARVLSEDEERMLLKESADHLRSIIKVGLNSGMRLGEILELQWNQVDFEARRIRVEKTKSGKTRFIPINDILLGELLMLRSRNGQSPYVFANPKTGKPLTTIKTAFNAACRRADIKGLWFHDLRRTFATRLLQRGADIETVRDLLGHRSIMMTQRYTHTNEDRKRRAVKLLEREENEKTW